jgi:hypothetical protein
MEENSMNLKRVICVAITLTLLATSPSWAITPLAQHVTDLDGTFNSDYVNNTQTPIATYDWANVPAVETNPANLADMSTRVANQIFNAYDPWGLYGGTAWDGPGYTSTLAKNNPKQNTMLGINTGAQFLSSYGDGTLFFGATVTANQVLLRYSYVGDFNLDGSVDSSDINNLVAGLNHGGNAAYTNYFYGDSNYDQSVDSSDINTLVYGLTTQGTEALQYTPPSTENWPTGGNITTVPEPSTLVLLILACASGLAAWKKMK